MSDDYSGLPQEDPRPAGARRHIKVGRWRVRRIFVVRAVGITALLTIFAVAPKSWGLGMPSLTLTHIVALGLVVLLLILFGR